MSNTGIVKSLPKSLPFNLPHGLAKQGGSTPPFALSGTLPDGDQATDYDGVLSITGGVAPYSNPQVVAGTLPGEFSLSIVGGSLHVIATAPISFSGLVSVSLTVDDASSQTTPPYPVTFTINEVTFITTESGDPIITEDNKFIIAE